MTSRMNGRWALVLALGVAGMSLPRGAAAQPLSVGFFRPWAGYGIPNGIWLSGDFNGDGKADADRTALIDAIIPYNAQIASIELTLGGKGVAARLLSKRAPTVKAAALGAARTSRVNAKNLLTEP
jgi:hypothetical protein